MSISFVCPHCGATNQIDSSYAGSSGQCGAMVATPSKRLPRATERTESNLIQFVVVASICLGVGACVIGTLLPSITGIPHDRASRRMSCSNNLKQIGLALHNYHDTYGSFPPAYIADADGRPCIAGVLILPFVEGKGAYDTYHFDEPWNSPANLAILEDYVPDWVQCPSDPDSNCSYFVVNAPGGIFDGTKATKIDDVQAADGTSNTILAVEVFGSKAKWYEPVDLGPDALSVPINSTNTGTSISSIHTSGAMAVFADGRVKYLPADLPIADLQALFTMNDGRIVELD